MPLELIYHVLWTYDLKNIKMKFLIVILLFRIYKDPSIYIYEYRIGLDIGPQVPQMFLFIYFFFMSNSLIQNIQYTICLTYANEITVDFLENFNA